MLCPVDGTELIMTERYGVEIDYCPKCRGVWLDRGELDKIIARAQQTQPPRPQDIPQRPSSQPAYEHHGRPYQERREETYDAYRPGKKYKKKKKGGWGDILEEIFDF